MGFMQTAQRMQPITMQNIIGDYYTMKQDKILREDDDDNSMDIVEFIQVDVDEDDDEYFDVQAENGEYDEFEEEHEEYALMRNKKLFGFELNTEINDDYIDYVNTVSWIWNKEGCNDQILKFMNLSICTENTLNDDVAVYIIDNNEEEEEVEELMMMNVRNMIDWDEIYYIDMSAENNVNNQKLCKFTSMIKLCVEISDDQYINGNINEMQISIEFL